MRKLIHFLSAYKHWLLLLVLQTLSLSLFLNEGLYRQGLRLYLYSYLTGGLGKTMTEGYSYLGLRGENERLLMRNAELEAELLSLRRSMALQEAEGAKAQLPDGQGDAIPAITARVVNKVGRLGDTYYLIDKGSADDLRVDMPVLSSAGIVGVVAETSEHYALVIPVVNPKLKLSCTIASKGIQGQLSSQGLGRATILGNIPLHAEVSPGDTILTSGHSYLFPEGIMVGVVEDSSTDGVAGEEAGFGTYRVSLATNFETLSYVYIRLMPSMEELKALEATITASE